MKRPGVFSFLWLFRPYTYKGVIGLRYDSSSGGDEDVPSEKKQRAQYFDELLLHFKWCRRFGYGLASLSLAAVIAAPFVHPAAELDTTIGQLIMGGGASAAAFFFTRVNKAKQYVDVFFAREEMRRLIEQIPEGPVKVALLAQLAASFGGLPNAEVVAKEIWQALLSGQFPQVPKP